MKQLQRQGFAVIVADVLGGMVGSRARTSASQTCGSFGSMFPQTAS
jgi:hypothetical protein